MLHRISLIAGIAGALTFTPPAFAHGHGVNAHGGQWHHRHVYGYHGRWHGYHRHGRWWPFPCGIWTPSGWYWKCYFW
jgi:hypothetical protein